MAKASDNPFPSLLLVEQAAAPATPAAGQARLYRGTDNKLYIVDDAGVATEVGAAGGSGQGHVDFARAKRTSGSITITASASYVNVDTALDLVLTAAAGDVIEVEPSVGIQAVTTAGFAVIDFVTVVAGSPVNSITTETAASNTGSHPSWGNANIPTATPRLNLTGPKRYTLVAGDISAGTVTLRLRIRCGSNMSLLATGDPALYVQATNLGPQL